MDSFDEKFHLYGTDSYITEGTKDAFRVATGSVFVFVAPMKGGKPNRRLLLCEISEGHLIPSFAFQDSEYVNWRFILVPRDEADLILLPGMATSVLYRRFARTAGLESFQEEGFQQSLIDFYKRESLKDNIYIELGQKNRPDVDIATYGVIRQAFRAEEKNIQGDEPIWRAVAFACRHSSIPLPGYEKVLAACGDHVTVPNIAHAARIGCRKVVLDAGWFHRDCGTIVSSIEGEPVACVPKGQERYQLYHGVSGEKEELEEELAETIDPEAYVLTRTFPAKQLTRKDLFRFGLKSIRKTDIVYVILLGIVGALIGILLPGLNQKVYDEYIPLGHYSQLLQICMVIAAFMIGNLLFEMVKKLSEFRIGSHVGYDFQNAVYDRVFHLPESFFRQYESADLAQRLASVSGLANIFVSAVLVSGLAAIFSILYLVRMIQYSARLSWFALLMIGIYSALIYMLGRTMLSYDREIEIKKGEASAKLFQLLTGIEKIRMAGVEDRAAYEYLLPFSEKQSLEINKNRISSVGLILSGSAGIVFSMVFYLIIVKSRIAISTGAFMAFNAAFGAFSAAVLGLVDGAIAVYQSKPVIERIKPVFEAVPEDEGDKEIPEKLKGNVSLHHVRFSYTPDGAPVLDDVNLDIAPGEYVGVVGPSGCGKSTLLKLLLGFEEPDQGIVCYDGKNLKQLDKHAVRKHLGVVLQNGKLIAGSIYDNITITAPNATMKEVKAVLNAVGLKADIDQMPMGVHTVLSENSSTISGGQQQRILIARAIISHPSILLFDEATSALDNLTQAAVCRSLDQMNVTRIVVAHRLSTIQNCDRIIVLREGKIVEQGNFHTLMEKKGFFYQLALRQLAD